jgi:hypothetical protein
MEWQYLGIPLERAPKESWATLVHEHAPYPPADTEVMNVGIARQASTTNREHSEVPTWRFY